MIEFALFEVPRKNGPATAKVGMSTLLCVEPQLGLALGLVGTVTLITVVREDGADVAIELDRRNVPHARRLRREQATWANRAGNRDERQERQ